MSASTNESAGVTAGASTGHEPLVMTRRLPPSGTAPMLVRRALRLAVPDRPDELPRTRASRATIEAAAQVAGELVALSVRQSRSVVDVAVTLSDDRIDVRVVDHPRRATAAPGVGTNRSMSIVQRLASSWGMDVRDEQRVLWATVTPPGATA